ncbi:MAG: FAD-dependent oxidoreductase [Betaproteobacteria bacterium]
MQTDVEVLVVGAGPAGIGAGLALCERALVVDGATEVGGLARTVDLEGAILDFGGHSFHTPHPDVRARVFDALPMEEAKRDAWCLVDGAWIPYPFQRHFVRHPDARLVESCRAGLAAARPADNASDFDAYLDARFGTGIAAAFMKPYNRKLWGDDLARMSAMWTAERVAAPAGVAEHFDPSDGQRKPLHDDTVVAYPARGGFGEIFAALARRLPRLSLGCEIAAIDPRSRTATARDGRRFRYRDLVSTLPLPGLLERIAGVPPELLHAVARLEAMPLTLAMFAVEGSPATTRQRVYVADAGFPGHKIVLNGNSSRWLASRARHGIVAEVSQASADRAGGQLLDRVAEGLCRTGLVGDPRRIVARRAVRLPLGYPVPTHERPAIVVQAKAWLAPRGIHTLGRFGEWDYINADEALRRGLHWPADVPAATAD